MCLLYVYQAHERELDGDVLLGFVHNILPSRPDLKLIVMSATIDAHLFSSHFHRKWALGLVCFGMSWSLMCVVLIVLFSLVCPADAPVIEIPGFTHPVSDLYLHDILHATRYVPPHYTRLSAMITAQYAAQSSPFIL